MNKQQTIERMAEAIYSEYLKSDVCPEDLQGLEIAELMRMAVKEYL